MEDKIILNEFAAKITKAKNLYNSTSSNCDKLKKEQAQLQKEYELIRSQREASEIMESSLREQLEIAKQMYLTENEKYQKESKHLNELRKNKKQLKREKDIIENELLKNTLSLEEQIREREKFQNTAKSLSDKLENTTAEKEELEGQYNRVNLMIEKHNKERESLKAEISDMKSVISNSSVPIYQSLGNGRN